MNNDNIYGQGHCEKHKTTYATNEGCWLCRMKYDISVDLAIPQKENEVQLKMKRTSLKRRSKKETLTVKALTRLYDVLGEEWNRLYNGACAKPGCLNCWCDWDHIHGRTGGETWPNKLDPTNLQPLCRFHHTLVTNGPHKEYLADYRPFTEFQHKMKAAIGMRLGALAGNMRYTEKQVAEVILDLWRKK
jgi:hypothetical protein